MSAKELPFTTPSPVLVCTDILGTCLQMEPLYLPQHQVETCAWWDKLCFSVHHRWLWHEPEGTPETVQVPAAVRIRCDLD